MAQLRGRWFVMFWFPIILLAIVFIVAGVLLYVNRNQVK